MILLAAFQLLLGRWSGQEDFAIGSPVANRTKGETERVDRILCEHASTPGRPLRRIRPCVNSWPACVRRALEAFENQEIPLEVLIPALRPQRDASRSPLFQVMFVLQNNALPKIHSLDLTLVSP